MNRYGNFDKTRVLEDFDLELNLVETIKGSPA